MQRSFPLAGVLGAVLLVPSMTSRTAAQYANFEGSQTQPLAISDDGLRLYAVNTPDNRLSVYSLADPDRPVLIREIRVGLEPVSVRPRTADEVWVVDQLSDSISVVSVSRGAVVATLHCGDEPGDVAFAGDPQRAFVSVQTAREVIVFDVATHRRVGRVPIFGDDPKALCASADGQRVWAAVFRSGNETTLVPEDAAPPPPPPTNPNLGPAPRQGIIVRADDPAWQATHGVILPDHDVVEIDAAEMKIVRSYPSVGTVLFHMAERPGHPGELWVAQMASLNLVRFEPNLRGHIVDNQVARIRTGPSRDVGVIDLNPQIDYTQLPNDLGLRTALAYPTGIAFSPSGDTVFVAAFGSDRIGVLDPSDGRVLARIEVGPASGSNAAPRQKRGPRGLAHHPTAPRLYVLNRLANSVGVVDTRSRTVLREIDAAFDPTPDWLREGRGFHYDTKLSGNGTASCASCHIDGTTDNLAWDLGDPGGQMETARGPNGRTFSLHPMKGPMLTQTFQGLRGHAPLHWRGDRATFQDFNPAFDKLLGKTQIPAVDMDAFTRFAESILYPPNPNLELDRSLPSQDAIDGRDFFLNIPFVPGAKCVDCHALPNGTDRNIQDTQTLMRSQPMKTAQLRNIYKRTGKKVGPAGMRTSGFGLAHNGEFDSVFDLLSDPVFQGLSRDTVNKTRVMAFLEAFDTGTAPAVGHAVTTGPGVVPDVDVAATWATLRDQARRRACDLVLRVEVGDRVVGFQYELIFDRFLPDQQNAVPVGFADALAVAVNGTFPMTAMGVPPGSGTRIGRDRDADSRLDGDERPRSFGAASPACASGLAIAANAPADLGQDGFAVVTSGAAPAVSGLLLVGFRPASLNVLGVDVLVDASDGDLLPFTTDARGVGARLLPIPPNQGLTGASVFVQSIVAEPCAPAGIAGTAGLEVVLGL